MPSSTLLMTKVNTSYIKRSLPFVYSISRRILEGSDNKISFEDKVLSKRKRYKRLKENSSVYARHNSDPKEYKAVLFHETARILVKLQITEVIIFIKTIRIFYYLDKKLLQYHKLIILERKNILEAS